MFNAFSKYRGAVAGVLCILAVTAAAAPLTAQAKPYCDAYYETLAEAAHDRLRGVPDYSETGNIVYEWRPDVAFIFDAPSGFDFTGWINRQWINCWESGFRYEEAPRSQ